VRPPAALLPLYYVARPVRLVGKVVRHATHRLRGYPWGLVRGDLLRIDLHAQANPQIVRVR